MYKFSWLLFFLFFVGLKNISAQKSAVYTHERNDFDKALSWYNDKQYIASQLIFDKVKIHSKSESIQSDCAYYIANCAIKTNQSNAETLIQNFVLDYPTSSKQNQVSKELAQYYFEQGDYKQAMKWFDLVPESSLSKNDLDKFNFQKGYSFFDAKNKKEATRYFNKVQNSGEYTTQAKYYLGFLAYEGDNYKEANKYFNAVSEEKKYKGKLSYYNADMNFKSGNFQKAIDLGQVAMEKSSAQEKSELNKIIGESYFNLKQYDKAIPNLEGYRGKNGKWNNTDFYQLGYAYYEQKQYENAISQFNKIIGGKDFVAQNAYYHLGECYLNTNKKQQALNAFKNASEMSFEPKLQEDASLNYAKLSYEMGNSYQSVPVVLNDFLTKYPNNASKPEIEKLLIDSYISSKNYKEALVLLEKNKTPENKLAYQKVLFYNGLDLYTDGNYREALHQFTNSVAEQKDAKITARATFWKGESEYVLEDFKSALANYKAFVSLAGAKESPEFKNSNYNLAYASFKLKEYEQAGNYFQSQIANSPSDKTRLNDSYLRLADCRFVTTKYAQALEAYNKVIASKSEDVDYAYYHKAICYGFMGENEKKIEDLNAFLQQYAKSEYRDDAFFELGNTYVAENKDDLAIRTYDKLNTEFKLGSFTAKAILRQGLVYYNADKDEQALTKFKKVASDFPKSPEALEAVATARLIYVDNGKVDEYATWVRTLDFVVVTDAELDNDTFEGAEKQYSQNNTKQAITGLSGYVSKFPNGIHALKANFYLAQSYYSDGQESTAVPNYEFVIGASHNDFTEQSLSRLAQIFLKIKNYDKSIAVLTRLETEAETQKNKTFAQANLMKCYYDQRDYPNSVVYAEKVLTNSKTDEKVKNDAQIIIARGAIKNGDDVKAKLGYAKLLPVAKGELGAEALYYDAYFKNKDGKFELSNTAVQKLAKNYSSYKYFGAKGLVVMAKNFYGLKDSYQATYILDNVIKNFSDFPEVVSEAKTELERIKGEESKTNESVAP
jgi:TolA-binding protein